MDRLGTADVSNSDVPTLPAGTAVVRLIDSVSAVVPLVAVETTPASRMMLRSTDVLDRRC
jgi:hypothetical protein